MYDTFKCFRITIGEFLDDDLTLNWDKYLSKELINKLSYGASKINQPWEYLIPWGRNASIGFISKEALAYYLFNVCHLTHDDLIDLSSIGYEIKMSEVYCLTKGESTIIGSFFPDEIASSTITSSILELWDIKDKIKIFKLSTPGIPKSLINDCKAKFYNNKSIIK